MSIALIGLVFSKRMGTSARKAIFLYLADRADDHGRGIYPSKSTIAGAADCSVRTVQRQISKFLQEGLLIEVGKKRCANGFVKNYAINVRALHSLPDAKDRDRSISDVVTSDTESSDGCHDDIGQVTIDHPNRQGTVNEPDACPETRKPVGTNAKRQARPKAVRKRNSTEKPWKKSAPAKKNEPSEKQAFLNRHFTKTEISDCIKAICNSTSDDLGNRRVVLDSDMHKLKEIFELLLPGEIDPHEARKQLEEAQ